MRFYSRIVAWSSVRLYFCCVYVRALMVVHYNACAVVNHVFLNQFLDQFFFASWVVDTMSSQLKLHIENVPAIFGIAFQSRLSVQLMYARNGIRRPCSDFGQHLQCMKRLVLGRLWKHGLQNDSRTEVFSRSVQGLRVRTRA